MILNNPDIDIDITRKVIKDKYGISVHSLTLYRARKWALKIRGKEYDDSYNKVYSHIGQVYTRNHGSYAVMQCLSPSIVMPSRFLHFFISFVAQKD